MAEWKEYKLGDFIDVKHGYAFSGANITDRKTQNILVTPGNFHIGGGFKDSKFKYFDGEYPFEYVLKENDIVVTMTDLSQETDTLGYSAKIPKSIGINYLHNQRIGLVQFKTDKVNKDFIYWLMRTKEYQWFIVSSASGTSIMHTAPTRIKEYAFPLPPLREQEAIAEVLSSLDDKIDLLHRQNKTLESMAEALFRQWFVEEAQEDWEEVKLGDMDIIITDYVANGSFESLAKNVTYLTKPDYAILIRLKDFNNNFDGDFVYVNEAAYAFLNKSNLIPGDVIISNVGEYSGTVFRCPKLDRPMTLGPNSIVIKSGFNNFFYLLFKSALGQHLLDGIISGSAQPKFNKTAFRNLVIKLPKNEILAEFEKSLREYYIKIDANQSQIRTLTQLRDTLLPRLMNGEVRVRGEG